ncbi:expressed unknown protein [Seminavis robusta]|uniref:Uncharacterized protein n=1 Tax=Seminavis robusta TaxID=568900 RepID=A0A9N8D6V7_9STRA|nr:expressed unknown protein [Seminavis robusta]|eukprot:Sro3_g001961.1  (307) ;mRNA; r:7859-8779
MKTTMIEEPEPKQAEEEEALLVPVVASAREDDDAFYHEVLQEMRARRLEKRDDSYMNSDMTESTSSMHSFLSWANSTTCTMSCSTSTSSIQAQNQMDDSLLSHSSRISLINNNSTAEHDENQYWRDLRLGKAPYLPRSFSGQCHGGEEKERGLDLLVHVHVHVPDLLSKLTKKGTSNHTRDSCRDIDIDRPCDFGPFSESVRLYRFSETALHQLAFEGHDFIKLQKSLRKQGAVTNALLKQVLPMVVLQSQRRRREKQRLTQTQTQTQTQAKPMDQIREEQSKMRKSPLPFLAQAFSFNQNQNQQQ